MMMGIWRKRDRFAKTMIRFAKTVIRIICKNGDQICRNGDQEVPQKSHLQFSVIRFADFSDQLQQAIAVFPPDGIAGATRVLYGCDP